ncbi:MAG TPA: cupredoxin domain-containing protein, partial [Thermomicrobiales bacterium]|nr:cupredoxin domain-containing protein [Thermomicrobiales bacterium]
IGLRELNNSGYTGIAYLIPTADGAGTNVSVFIAETQAKGQRAGRQAAATPVPAAAATPAMAGSANAPVDVSLSEFKIDMPDTLPAGTTTFNVTNNGTIVHSFEFQGQGIEKRLPHTLNPGESATLTLDLKPGKYEAYCPVDGHKGMGMDRAVTVQ